jgi:hypothetical protein
LNRAGKIQLGKFLTSSETLSELKLGLFFTMLVGLHVTGVFYRFILVIRGFQIPFLEKYQTSFEYIATFTEFSQMIIFLLIACFPLIFILVFHMGNQNQGKKIVRLYAILGQYLVILAICLRFTLHALNLVISFTPLWIIGITGILLSLGATGMDRLIVQKIGDKPTSKYPFFPIVIALFLALFFFLNYQYNSKIHQLAITVEDPFMATIQNENQINNGISRYFAFTGKHPDSLEEVCQNSKEGEFLFKVPINPFLGGPIWQENRHPETNHLLSVSSGWENKPGISENFRLVRLIRHNFTYIQHAIIPLILLFGSSCYFYVGKNPHSSILLLIVNVIFALLFFTCLLSIHYISRPLWVIMTQAPWIPFI